MSAAISPARRRSDTCEWLWVVRACRLAAWRMPKRVSVEAGEFLKFFMAHNLIGAADMKRKLFEKVFELGLF
ncbi:hypothetical protein JCM12107_14070 [Corynebacterium simulans]